MEALKELRAVIDEVDSEMMALFERRMDTVCRVAEVKKRLNAEVLQAGREQEVIDKCCGHLVNKEYEESATKFMKFVMQLSREEQNKRIG